MSRHRVVIIGSGFGGLTAAKALRRAPKGSQVDITLISKTTTHLFQPLLYQVATGILSEGDVAPTTRLILRKQKNVRVLWGEVNAIDLKAQTVTSKLMGMETVTPYDSLIVAAGAQQSYFGNDEFATYAPGMKTIDDALELRGRILGSFEAAEVATDPAERQRRLTFVVVGAGPTGVEVAGQIVELAERTLAGAFRTIKPTDCRVILLDAAPAVLPPMGAKLGLKAQHRLEKMNVEVQLNAMVTAVDYKGITIKEKDGGERRIECACKVWAAGVQASSLGKMIAEQSDGTEVDRAGRVIVEPDLTVKGHPNVFVVGDLMSVPGVPGMAQGAIQGASYATKTIKQGLKGQDDPANRKPFKYFDKGSMATVSRFSAVAQVGKLEFGGFAAWLAWLVLHLYYLVGHRNRIAALFAWGISFLGRGRGQMAITSQMIYARPVVNWVEQQAQEGTLAAAERAEAAESKAG
ncbi:NAD(P)/FAD-dependent oxidoreductase [Mycobacterium malmoense]|uniref:NADH:ubiquinone reductase (non-electrogenic) n=1 Tax=Mycobacterium malmoense TaxID=1780 RepID=A0ABX3SNJ7_MYCMA|nr:NAD(P)/FAD-dependent oxidoreductase [Mycobacterium malmoense]ORA79296.1 FAD-dependent oxidoreductase [Mycobacterium malmoense]QZA18180.1 NAD(P)/FAD-dependent oxidoreductase [Mycobacterium malmoense]UNB94954.1 NAD(P)/FAD-dependent oxidoreductase [Mycobacterium malmoense]